MWYNETAENLFSALRSNREGLSDSEAEERLKRGYNELPKKKPKSFFMRFLSGACDKMTLILLAAAAISFATSLISGESFADPIMILLIVVLNSLIAAFQESKAEKALLALEKLSSPETKVKRGGKIINIPSRELVEGDVFFLEKGDIVPCDARILKCVSLSVDESALTGESLPVIKSPENAQTADNIMEASDCVFSSTSVVTGKAEALAVKVGKDTFVGSIASSLGEKSEPTPLQKRLSSLGAVLGNVTLAVCAVIFVLSLLRGMDFPETFLTSVSLSVAAIPEGLPAIVTVVLSAGVRTLASKNALVKRLPAVETLGRADVICSDKTGTLTKGEMTVTDIIGDEAELCLAFTLCGDSSSPTEKALTDYAAKVGFSVSGYKRVFEIPFDSEKKYMLTVSEKGGSFMTHIKGAPDVVASFCGEAEKIKNLTSEMADKGLRVMCFACRETPYLPSDPEKLRFRFIGLCGMTDPLRDGVKEAVKSCKKAGVRVIMLTGDHKATALSVAEKLSIPSPKLKVCTEKELSGLNEKEFSRAVSECNVFARVTPAFKLKVVKELKKRGHIVAMTGDGVNDAPALKEASIGCAMGVGGTEVAKNTADIVLADDDFSTVVAAVKEGRGIYDNVRRAVRFLLSCNIGELLTMFAALLINLPSPLSAIQLLWVNLTTDSLPAIALGLEKTDGRIMERPPIKPRSPLFSAPEIAKMVFEGILIGSMSVLAFVLGSKNSFLAGRTMCFAVLSVSQLFHSFDLRSEKSVFSRGLPKNPFIFVSFAVCFALQSSVILIPKAASLFGVAMLSPTEWALSLALASVPLWVSEIYKLFKQKSK